MVSEDLPEWFNSKKKEEKKIKKRIDSHTTWWAQSHKSLSRLAAAEFGGAGPARWSGCANRNA
jgi:hypothetical protein